MYHILNCIDLHTYHSLNFSGLSFILVAFISIQVLSSKFYFLESKLFCQTPENLPLTSFMEFSFGEFSVKWLYHFFLIINLRELMVGSVGVRNSVWTVSLDL